MSCLLLVRPPAGYWDIDQTYEILQPEAAAELFGAGRTAIRPAYAAAGDTSSKDWADIQHRALRIVQVNCGEQCGKMSGGGGARGSP